MAENFLLKEIFNEKMVSTIGTEVKKAWSPFNEKVFTEGVMRDLGSQSLTERAWAITSYLSAQLPLDFEHAAPIIRKVIEHGKRIERKDGYQGFFYMPFANYVAKYGIDYFDISMELLNAITRLFTAEFAIRPFIEKHPEKTMKLLHEWAKDPNEHVRRLVSEGTRTRLPWASRSKIFQNDPEPVIALLEKLRSDPKPYVRRSVANSLNDISKDYPELVVDVLSQWRKSENSGTQWIIEHACRSLVKDGNAKALALLGFNPTIKVEIKDLKVKRTVEMGSECGFEFKVVSKEDRTNEMMIDFVVHYQKANGRCAPKVFKLKKVKIRPGEEMSFQKKISFRSITTRKYYPGKHAIEIQVNGKRMGKVFFELKMP